MKYAKKIICFHVVLAFVVLVGCSKQDKQLEHIIKMDENEIEKISLDIPGHKGELKSTINRKEIDEFITYMNDYSFKKIRGDAQSYMPKLAVIIYIYGNDQESFLVPYGKEMMIDKHVYGVSPDSLDLDFFDQYYNELEERSE